MWQTLTNPLAQPHKRIGVAQNSHHKPRLSRTKNFHVTALWYGVGMTFSFGLDHEMRRMYFVATRSEA